MPITNGLSLIKNDAVKLDIATLSESSSRKELGRHTSISNSSPSKPNQQMRDERFNVEHTLLLLTLVTVLLISNVIVRTGDDEVVLFILTLRFSFLFWADRN